MADKLKILAFAGSTRKDSYNKKLVRIAVEAARRAGAEVTLVDLRDLAMPLYDGDLEASEGIPPNGKKFKELMKSHQGFLISTPEYNRSIPGVLKNAIDWASRKEGAEAPLVCFEGKCVAIISASPGAYGAFLSLTAVQTIFSKLGSVVIPDSFSLPKAHEAFDSDGNLKDAKQLALVEEVASSLVDYLKKLLA